MYELSQHLSRVGVFPFNYSENYLNNCCLGDLPGAAQCCKEKQTACVTSELVFSRRHVGDSN